MTDTALLKELVHNTRAKSSSQIVVSSNKTRFNTRFDPRIDLKTDVAYEIALVNLETYYSFPNIDASNNYFRYSPDGGVTFFDIYIPEGSYELMDINLLIQQRMRQNGHYDETNEKYYITISENINTLKSILTMEDGISGGFSNVEFTRQLVGIQ